MLKLYLNSGRIILLLLCLVTQQAWSQSRSVSGTVTAGDDSSILPGVTILEKGTQNGTVSDANGNFTLQVSDNAVLQFSFVGYTTTEIAVGTQTSIKVSMATDVATLQEVVVIGYGSVKKSDATGSVAVVDSKTFNKGVVNSPQELIMGKTAGVSVTTNSGAPGNTSTIRIRGGASLNASNDPLIVIDGVPISNDNLGGSPNILSTINPNDIESFTVLKDASATAIYGLRAANGVIIITTKRGGSNFKINYTVTATGYTTPKKVKVYSGDEFRALVTAQNPGNDAVTNLLTSANTDWQKQIYKKLATGQDHNISVSGTTMKIPYRVSFGYNNTDGVLRTYNFQRTTLNVAVDPKFLNDKLAVSVNVKAMNNNNNFAEQSAVGNAIAYDPTKPVYDGLGPDSPYRGYTTWTNPDGTPINLAPANPVAQLALTDNRSNVKRTIGNIKLDYQLPFISDLHAVLNLGYDYTDTKGHNNVPDRTQWQYNPTVLGGRLNPYNAAMKNQLLDFYLKYSKDIKSINSKIDVTAGYSWAHFSSHGGDSTMNASGELPAVRKNVFITEYFLLSFFGRLNYTFHDKYLLTASLRDDATSRFSKDNRWGLFPSVAVGWKLKQETFLQSVSFLSELKLRAGYGTTGQQDIYHGDYPYIATYTSSNNTSRYPFGSHYYNTLRPDAYNANIKWENNATINAGFDYGFFQNRLTGSIDGYLKKSTDVIADVPPAQGTNFGNSITSNVGDLTNKGVEININYLLVDNNDFQWTLGYNITFNKNRITKLNLNNDPNFYIPTGAIGGTTSGTIQAHKVGYSRSSYLVYQQVYDANGKPLEDVYVDRNHDGVINTADQYIYKKPDASVYMGINSRMSYKNFDFAFSGRVSLGNYVYNNVAANSTYRTLYNSMGYLSNVSKQADLTKFTTADQTRFSDFYVQNGSFFRMDNINLGYTFRNLVQSKGSVRIGCGVQNAFVITKYKGIDPEISGGLDNNFFPRTRSFFLNLNATF